MVFSNIKLAIFSLLIVTTLSIENLRFELSGRIVRGSDAKTSQFPYFASLINSKSFRHFCGGTIISPWHILTAGHCVLEKKPNSFLARVGITNVKTDNATFYKIEKAILHPNYVKKMSNDIALLKTVDEINYTKLVQPIALARSNVAAEGGQNATVCGLGVLNQVRNAYV